MHAIITTKAIGSAASAAGSNIAHFAGSCKAAAVLAGHKISLGMTVHVLPAIKIAWAKCIVAATPVAHFVATPLGMCVVGVAVGAVTTTVGITLILAARGDKLAGEQNNITRRLILTAGIVLGVTGIGLIVAGAVGGTVILV